MIAGRVAQEGTALGAGHSEGTAAAAGRGALVGAPGAAPAPASEAPGSAPGVSECALVGDILARVGDKWTMLVVMTLEAEGLRFNEIKRRVGRISQRMLTVTLRGLERDGLVLRTVTPSTPPRVDYALTALGRSLAAAVKGLGQWAARHRGPIEAAREAFDGRNAGAFHERNAEAFDGRNAGAFHERNAGAIDERPGAVSDRWDAA